jgi:hypothetical protein
MECKTGLTGFLREFTTQKNDNENPIMDSNRPESRIPRWHMAHGLDGKLGSEALRLHSHRYICDGINPCGERSPQ